MKANYHTHTPLCHHAAGSLIQYADAAVESGFDVLGFSDHTPWAYASDFVSGIRMNPQELPAYVKSVRALSETYSGKLQIKLGLECEYFPAYMGYLAEQKEAHGLDYLILGNHFDLTDETGMYFGRSQTPAHVNRYIRLTISGMQSGLFAYLAHPDLYLMNYGEFDATCKDAAHELCRAARDMNMPLEYNLQGLRVSEQRGAPSYTHPAFWEIAAQEGVTAIIGADAHEPDWLKTPLWEKSLEYLTHLGIHTIHTLDI